jgi:hypothetical protein
MLDLMRLIFAYGKAQACRFSELKQIYNKDKWLKK